MAGRAKRQANLPLPPRKNAAQPPLPPPLPQRAGQLPEVKAVEGKEALLPPMPALPSKGVLEGKHGPLPPPPEAKRPPSPEVKRPPLKMEPPRYLDVKEIEDIMDAVPPVTAAAASVAAKTREQIRAKLAMQLNELKVSPSVIPQLKGYIINQFHRSVANACEPLGLRTGESVGQPMSQMNLSSFHHTGSAKSMSMGVDGARELFNASQRRRHEVSTIHFKNKNLGFDEVLELRRVLVGVTVGDLTHQYSIEANHRPDGTIIPLLERGWWYEMHNRIVLPAKGRKFPPAEEERSTYYLRVRFNTTMLYTYKLTLEDVAAALEANMPPALFCVYSPSSEGIIDIYPEEAKIQRTLVSELGENSTRVRGITPVNASLLFLQLFVGPRLADYVVKGMKGITQIFPVEVTTWSIVRSEELAFSPQRLEAEIAAAKAKNTPALQQLIALWQRTWILHIDTIRMRMTGLTFRKLRELFERCKITLPDREYTITVNQIPRDLKPGERPAPGENRTQVSITLPEGWETAPHMPKPGEIKPEDYKPGLYVSRLIRADEDRLEEEAKAKRKPYEDQRREQEKRLVPRDQLVEVPYFRRVPTPLISAGTYVYAEANGTNLRKLLAHPLVDGRRTISNSLHEILDVLGVEACRNYISREFYDLITGSTAYINPRYIALIADFMTNMGILVPITSRGVARQHRGALADASFEHPVEIFRRAATSGRWDEVVSTSTAIFLGQRIRLGTGGMGLGLREDVLADIEKLEALIEEKNVASAIVEPDLDKILTDDQFEGSGMRKEESDVGTVDDVLNVPPVFNPQPSAQLQAPLAMLGPGGNVLLEPGLGLGGVPHRPMNLLAPKGPIPEVVPSIAPLPPWVAAIIGNAPINVDPSGLPPLGGLDFAGLVALAPAAAAHAEVDFLSPDALLALQ